MKSFKDYIEEAAIIAAIISEKGEGDKAAFKKFYDKTLAKFGVKSPSELDDEKKKKFFDAIDAGWEGDDEEAGIEEGHTPVHDEEPEYEAKSEKSKFSDGWRSVVYDKTSMRNSMVGGTSYKNKADAVGEAQAYIDVLMSQGYMSASGSRSENMLDKAIRKFSKGKVVATPYKK